MPWQNISNKCVILAVIKCFCTFYFRSKRWVINSRREDLLKKDCGYLYNNCRMCAKHFTQSQLCATKLMATLVVTLQETIPFRILHFCKHHKSGDFAKSILRCYIRHRLHYYFKFETRALIQKKVKKTRKLQILKHK